MKVERYITVFACLLLLSPCLQAQTPFEIEEVVVVGEEFDHTRPYTTVAKLDHEQITALPVASVADILAYLPAIDIRSRGASSAQTDISMQGGTFDQVVVLLNGIPLQDTQTGHYTMNIPVSTALIEYIEVLQGTDVTGALTGAINIVTKTYTDQDHYTLQMTAGTNGNVHPVFTGTWKSNETTTNASVEYGRSEGYYAPTSDAKEQEALHNTDYQMANVYVQTHWRGLNQGLDVQVGAQYKDAGLGTGYGYASTDQFDATRTVLAGVQYEHYFAQPWKISAMVAYRGQYDRYEWHRGTPLNTHWTHNAQATLYGHYFSSVGKTSFGVEAKNEYIASSNMGVHNRWQVTARARQEFAFREWSHLHATLSVAGHYNSWCGWYGSGAAMVAYDIWGNGDVHVRANRSLRMPTWTDMYYKAGVQRGSTDLKAEKAWQVALGAQYEWRFEQAGRLHISGETYYRWGTDIIDWTYNETDSLFHATNQNKVNTLGVELAADYHYNNWLRTISVQYAYTHLDLDVSSVKSNYLDYLRHKVCVNLDHGIYVWEKGCVGAHWALRWQDRCGTYVDIHGTAGNAFTPVLLLDGSIYMELAHVRVALECANMTNRHYYDYGGVLMPGINGSLSIKAAL